MPPGRTTKLSAKDKRSEIIEAAADLFSSRGYDGTKIADIGRQVGIAHTLILYHFKTKEALWRETIAYCHGKLIGDFDEALKDTVDLPATERLKLLMRKLIRHNIAEPRSAPIIINETQLASPRLTWLTKAYLKPVYDSFDTLIAQAQADGAIRNDVQPYHLTQIVMGACSQFTSASFRMKRIYGTEAVSAESYALHAEVAIETLFTGFGARGAVQNSKKHR